MPRPSHIPRRLLQAAGAYLAVLAVLYFAQAALLYYPDSRAISPGDKGLAMEQVMLATEDGLRLQAWYSPAPARRPTVLFFGGNGGNISHHAPLFQQLLDARFGLLAVNYRGYGGSEGRPSQAGLYRDGLAGLAYLRQQGVPESRLVIYGQSLGSAVAGQVAARARARAVVLEAPFVSVEARARELFWFLPIGLLIRERYDNRRLVRELEEPLLIMHGARDLVVPIEHGRALYRLAREPKAFVAVEGWGHDDLPPSQVLRALERFLAETEAE